VPHAGRDPLDIAVLLAESIDPSVLAGVLAQGIATVFACDWCTVLDVSGGRAIVVAEAGVPPSAAWLGAFAGGARAGLSLSSGDGSGLVGPRDVAWSPLSLSDLVVVAGRDGPPFRSRERRQLQQLCRVADARWCDLVHLDGRSALSEDRPQDQLLRDQRLTVS
jgi:hypothetical protein